MQKKYIIFIGIVFIALIGISVGVYKKKTTHFLNVKKGDVLEAIYGLGKVKSDQVFEVKIGIMSNVTSLDVKEGDEVKAGQKLISFSGMTAFTAPFAGTISLVAFQLGEMALPQVPIIRLENLKKKYIEVSLEQEAALKVRKNQPATILFESLTNTKLEGYVKSIFPKGGEFLSHIEVESIPDNILPGMTADVVIKVGSKKDALLLPVRAITDGRVVRLRNNKKETIEIGIGHSDGIWAELTRGDVILSDQLVVRGKE